MGDVKVLSEPKGVLYRIKRGLAGYVSYLAACEMNESFSEYVLYEPILRVLRSQSYNVKCEVICHGIQHQQQGDRKRLDFVAEKENIHFAMEVKWAKKKTINVTNDIVKLRAYCSQTQNTKGFLCVFGTKSNIDEISLTHNDNITEIGNKVIAEFGVTKYACRIYGLAEPPL
jgi:Holliday junction resolvase